ncbi:MAG: pyroglutamyl-peptidase I, partial [Planctomycetota bacterium]
MILVTGFEAFQGLPRNPSGEVARAVAGDAVHGALLPVDFAAVGPALSELLARRWDAVLLLGLAEARSRLSLERVAVN